METEQHFKELLDKYLAGTCTAQEKAVMEEWFSKGGNSSKTGIELEESKRAQLLARIHALQDRQAQPAITVQRAGWREWLTGWRAAAVWIAVLVTAGIATWRSGVINSLFTSRESFVAYELIQTGKGEVKQILLPDSSVVMLNANSTLEYHPDFAEHRQIRLSGEALFSVTRDKTHPFTVQTSDSLVTTVLGTRFNIRSYEKSQDIGITVVSGVVAVDWAKHSLDTLTRSQAIHYQKASRSFTLSDNINTESVTGWTSGKWEYDNLRFNDLAILLHNYYGIALTSRRNTDTLQTGVSVNFNSKQSVKDILEVFCAFAGCSFRENGPADMIIY